MDSLLDPGFLGGMIPIVAVVGGVVALMFRRWTKHKERMTMIEQGLDPDERAKLHKERMAMIKHGLDPDRPALADPEHDPELIER